MSTVGFQVAANTKVGTTSVGVNLNAVSIDILGIRQGTISPNKNTPEIRQEAELNIGVLNVGYTKVIKDTDNSIIMEESTIIGTPIGGGEKKTISNYTSDYQQKGESTSETKLIVPELKVKAAIVIGAELSIDLNKIWDSITHLIHDT